MDKLIEALQIFMKYKNVKYPTHCEHDVLMVVGITKEEVSPEDKARLKKLTFSWNSEYDCWSSYHFGRA